MLADEVRLARGEDIIEEPIYARQTFSTPPGVSIVALSPDANVMDELHEKVRPGMDLRQLRRLRNRLSAALWIRFGEVRLFLTGEVEDEQYDWMSKLFRSRHEPLHDKYGPHRAHWIKLSHHGAEGNNPPFLFQHFAVSNNFVASASAGGANGHPHPTVLNLLAKRNGKAMCTRLGQGCAHIQSNGLDPDPARWATSLSVKNLLNPRKSCYGDITVEITKEKTGNTVCRVFGATTQAQCPYGGPPSGEVTLVA